MNWWACKSASWRGASDIPAALADDIMWISCPLGPPESPRSSRTAARIIWRRGLAGTGPQTPNTPIIRIRQPSQSVGQPQDSARAGITPAGEAPMKVEPPRVCRRLQLLRRWSHDKQTTNKFSPEVRARAVRMVLDHEASMRRDGRRLCRSRPRSAVRRRRSTSG